MEFREELESLKEQLRFSETFDVPQSSKNIAIAGMGGSGIAAKLFQELYSDVPIYTIDDYSAPSFIGDDTLFIALSYSGNTEETLAALEDAKRRGARTAAITSGGKLESMAEQVVKIPKGLQPRSALGYMLMPMIRAFGVFSEPDIGEAYDLLKGIDGKNDGERRMAEEIASGNCIPVIYGIAPYRPVAYRWKTQFNENAKILAYSSSFPELNHNDTMALRDTYRKDEFYFIVLSNERRHETMRRVPITERITNTEFRIVSAEGVSELSRMLGLVHRGDYVSYHLAGLMNRDPKDVGCIEDLKRELDK